MEVCTCTENAQASAGESESLRSFVMNLEFSKRLRRLEYKGLAIQYQLACLSTLGGAYHLTNKPETAFMIAYRQEMVGRLMGSVSVAIRAKVFQAVNLSLLGQDRLSKCMFAACKRMAAENSWAGMAAFVEASETWLRNQRAAKAVAMSVTDFCTNSGACELQLQQQPNEESKGPEQRKLLVGAL